MEVPIRQTRSTYSQIHLHSYGLPGHEYRGSPQWLSRPARPKLPLRFHQAQLHWDPHLVQTGGLCGCLSRANPFSGKVHT